jgi:hypothetical protein
VLATGMMRQDGRLVQALQMASQTQVRPPVDPATDSACQLAVCLLLVVAVSCCETVWTCCGA